MSNELANTIIQHRSHIIDQVKLNNWSEETFVECYSLVLAAQMI